MVTTNSVEKLVSELTEQVVKNNADIQDTRPPLPERAEINKSLIERAGQVRGRPLYYPYVGTGRGRGPFVELSDGSVKLDLINGIGIHLFGHAHPRLIAASVRGSLSDIVNQGNLQPNTEYIDFLSLLTQLAGKKSRLKYGWLSTCGTMANESALKITRQKRTPARMVLCFENAFAGRSTMMAELTDNPAYKVGLPDYHEMLRLPWYNKKDPQSSEKTLRKMQEHVEKHRGNISVFTFEPMLGEGGYRPAPREFFLPLLQFCREQKIPVWFDEVQTFSRTGELFAFETLDLGEYVDLCTIAKTAQVGVTLYTEEMNPAPGLIAGTFSGASGALAAGIESLKMLSEGNYFGPAGRVAEIHQRMIRGLQKLGETTLAGKIQDAEGMGLMMAFTPFDGKKETIEKLLKVFFKNGLIAFSCGKDPVRIRMLVPIVITNQEIDRALALIEQSMLEGV